MRLMQERFENQKNLGRDTGSNPIFLNDEDCVRLEEVGDLHFHASAYSSALDYYRQLCSPDVLTRLTRSQALRLLRKATDAAILQGDFNLVDLLLQQADDVLASSPVEDPQLADVNRAIFQARRATALRERGRLNEALNLGKRAFSVLALTDMHADVARLQVGMGICHMRLGKLEKAEEFFGDGLATFRRINHDMGVANLLNNLALIHKIRCRWDQALNLMERAVELARTMGASHLLPGFYLNQAIVLQKTDRLGEARGMLEKGLRLAVSLGDRLRRTRIQLAYGRLEILAGRLARAEELILAGKTLADENGFLREATIADEYLGDVMLARGDFAKARFNYELGLEKARRIAAGNDLEGELQRRMGEACLAAGDQRQAIAISQAAISICERCGEDYEIGFCHLTLGQAYSALRDVQQSDHHFRQAIRIFHDQRLVHLWCKAIILFGDKRLDSAGEAELLLLRRYLMDAQENGASSVSDAVLCAILERLAKVQSRLGQFDDALLTVFELERLGMGLEDRDLGVRIVELRGVIEKGLLVGVHETQRHLDALSSAPCLPVGSDPAVPRNLGSILEAGLERVHATGGFIAMHDEDGSLVVAARRGMSENLSLQLVRWCKDALASEGEAKPVLYSRLSESDQLIRDVPALAAAATSCIFLPIGLYDRRFGVMFLSRKNQGTGFPRASLDFLATYMGFLALFLQERSRRVLGEAVITPLEDVESFENIITRNAGMLEVLELARKVASSELTVLLTGETGTGKGLLAYSIHALSRRASRKFMAINCAAIPEALLESELFGHKKGSFTGAYSDKVGLLAEAEGGTVFLDEIGKMPLAMPGKLLQFLDTRRVRRVGDNIEARVDVRIICASKRDLKLMAADGLFLEDLYYRLRDFPLTIPNLRDRADDIELLTRHFVQRFCQELGIGVLALDHGFLQNLLAHPWPGNVRELEKTLKRAIVLAQNDTALRSDHLPDDFRRQQETSGGSSLKETLAAVEYREISRVLQQQEGNKAATARVLKVSYPNLLKKIRIYGIES